VKGFAVAGRAGVVPAYPHLSRSVTASKMQEK